MKAVLHDRHLPITSNQLIHFTRIDEKDGFRPGERWRYAGAHMELMNIKARDSFSQCQRPCAGTRCVITSQTSPVLR